MRACFALLLLLVALPTVAQDAADLPFRVELVEVDGVEAWPALHSFAQAQYEGRWLIVAGRVDGLHGGLQGFDPDPFPTEYQNDAVWVLEPATGAVWSSPLDALPAALADPLQSTNTQFHQSGETLYVVGGYGTDSATDTKVTFPTLTAIDVPGMIEAVTTGGTLAPHLRQTTDERLKVSGGELAEIEGRYYLVGGHLFDGEYTGDNTGDFVQVYTDAIRSFRIEDDDAGLAITDYALAAEDAVELHRRDLTVAPVIQPDGSESLGLYGGVFTQTGFPFLNPIYFTDDAEGARYVVDTAFEQQFAHYTVPALPLFDAASGAMHTTFFGGMGLYTVDDASGEVEIDYLVPFIDDVSTLTRGADGVSAEVLQPFRMPGLLGTNAAYVPAPDVPRYTNGVVRLRDLSGRTLVGHIFGGLEADSPHPGRISGTSGPSRRLFEVWVSPNFDTAVEPGAAPLAVALEAPYPNPFRTEATVAFVLDRDAVVTVDVFDALGRRVARLHDGPLAARRHAYTFRAGDLPAGVYYARVHGDGFSETRPLVRVR